MASRSRWPRARAEWQGLIRPAVIMSLAFLLAMASLAVAAPYQPYESGPVIHDSWLVPSAPYTAGTTGYQPYETGPVIHDSWLVPSAPYTAGTTGYQPYETGPVIHDSWLVR